MNRIFSIITFLSIVLSFIGCHQKQTIFIVCEEDIRKVAGEELIKYLSETYPGMNFKFSDSRVEGKESVVFELSAENELGNEEAFEIVSNGNEIKINGNTSRALLNGAYGLLKEIGWNFYLSFDVPPVDPDPLDFSHLNFKNKPLKEKRIIFNWHNFLSGCTGWDYPQWESWIDNSAKIGFNTIMVHAYGNNPMHSFSFNGIEKETGYFSTTQKGRDWGTEHVNDVRLIHGGELFAEYEFGAKVAKVPESERVAATTNLMKEVFKHATEKEMGVCFAVDVDTWMANPQNVINTLPDEAIIKIGGYKTVNPEHPEGRKYYEAQLKQLFNDYPEITMLAAWMRRPRKIPGLGSIWLQHDSKTLPEEWRKEYFDLLGQHPELGDERPYPGLFAISKTIQAYREILDDIKPETELVLGSWEFTYTKQAEAFIPKYCGFIPLDYDYNLKQQEVIEYLEEVGEDRKLYPIVWAHHDDHRYVGRPYHPYENFNKLLDKTNANGYGIIHWLTHPLDLVFTNYESQVWEKTENEMLDQSVRKFTESLLKSEEKNMLEYYSTWFQEAPMFGRETSDYFLKPDEEYKLEGYQSATEVVKKAKERLAILQRVDKNALKSEGLKEYSYQTGMEGFIISFFTNHHHLYQANQFLNEGQKDSALFQAKKLNPEEAIKQFAETISSRGATKGELGLLVSLNLRWLPDFIDVRQRTGLAEVRINFQLTSHDSLAQYPGNYTFFVDSLNDFWLSLGEKELGIPVDVNENIPLNNLIDSWLVISESEEIPLKTIRNNQLLKSKYKLQFFFAPEGAACLIQIIQEGEVINSFSISKDEKIVECDMKSKGKAVLIRILPNKEPVRLAGIKVVPVK